MLECDMCRTKVDINFDEAWDLGWDISTAFYDGRVLCPRCVYELSEQIKFSNKEQYNNVD